MPSLIFSLFARYVYSAVLWVLTPLYFLRLLLRSIREPLYRHQMLGRLGYGKKRARRECVWVHAVSLGETRAAQVLINAMREIDPTMPLLLTHSTASGWAAGSELLRNGDLQAWLPYDTPGAVKRFLRKHRPSVGVLVETEVWPNLMQRAEFEDVTMVLANGRLSDRSLGRGLRVRPLLRPAYALLSQALAQTEQDAFNLRKAGARGVRVMGNIKFDMTPHPRLLARGLAWRQTLHRTVIVAASTRKGEEQPLLDVWARVRQPRPLLVIVPRHPQRFDEVAQMVMDAGLSCRRRSHFGEMPPPDAERADVWLGDSLGEMPTYYGLSDAALLGGSFAPLGGQNLIEAAACGCPIVMGPHTFNFAQAAQLARAAGAAHKAESIEEGVAVAVALARDPNRNQWVQRAFAFAGAHRGAAQRMADAVLCMRNSGAQPTR